MRAMQHIDAISHYESKELREEKVLRMMINHVDPSKCGASVLGIFGTEDVSADAAFRRIREAPPNDQVDVAIDMAVEGVRHLSKDET